MPSAGKAIYTGTYPRPLDDKGRITIPSEWRSMHEKDETFMAIRHPGGYVMVLPPAEVDKLHDRISALKLLNPKEQAKASAIFAKAQRFTWDTFGRVLFNADLLGHAGITGKEVVLIGSMTTFALYSPERLAEQERQLAAAAPEDATLDI